MDHHRQSSGQTPDSLADLFTRYLQRQITAQAEGLAIADPDGQAFPHEAVPVQPVDPRLAWEDALAVVRHFPKVGDEARGSVPPEWPALVASQEPAIALAFCIGNYPQMVRNLHPLLGGGDLTRLSALPSRPVCAPAALLQWAAQTHEFPQILLASSVLRLVRRFDEAAELLRARVGVPRAWELVWANEEAALLWHQGRGEEALACWQKQKACAPILFNRGMAALFLGRAGEARAALTAAVEQLPETSAWHHLGQLYLALAAARS
jgi:tetratricopeptide (TPR) repeat protein